MPRQSGALRQQGIFAQMRHMQAADRDAIAADLGLRAGQLIVHDTGIVDNHITGCNELPLVAD